VPDELFQLCANVSAGDPTAGPEDRQIICGMVASVDMAVLQLLLALEEKGMLGSTLIVYHSDNGGFVDAGSINKPFRGQKASVFEGGIRVPAFMFGNGLHVAHLLTPERSDLVHVSDVLPTLLAYAGLYSLLNSFDGYNHWYGLVTAQPLRRLHVPVNSASNVVDYFSAFIETFPADPYWRWFDQRLDPLDRLKPQLDLEALARSGRVEHAGQSAVAGVTWKYLYNPSVLEFFMVSGAGATYTPEGEFLFDLSTDPYETTNLAHDSEHWGMLQYMRVRTLYVQWSSETSQLEQMPPAVLDAPPSPLGCWLPVDSPLYDSYTCPITKLIPIDTTAVTTDTGTADSKEGDEKGVSRDDESEEGRRGRGRIDMTIHISEWGAIVDPYLAS
jgi:hypothetical protein